MTKPTSIATTPTSEEINIVNPEGFGSNDEGLAMQGVVSVCDNARKRGKDLLGSNFEELETLSKRAKVEFFEDSSTSEGLNKALKRLTLSKAKRECCEGSSDRSKQRADSDVSMAECLLHAEVLLEWVKTRDKLNVAEISLKARDDEVTNLKNQITIMEDKLKDAAQIYSEDTVMKHILLARIVAMMESAEAAAYLNVKEEIETFKLKFPDIKLEEYGMFVENSSMLK